jgi:hypothetical protein
VVQNSRKALRTNTLRPVNLPELLKVDEDSSGLPLAVIDSVAQSSSAVKNSVAKMPLSVKNSVAKLPLLVKDSVAQASLPVTKRTGKQSVISDSHPIPAKAGIHAKSPVRQPIVSAPPPIPTKSLFLDLSRQGIGIQSGRQLVIAIEDRWRIDDEWWRNEPVSRFYYSVRFASGQRLVLYKDLIQGKWYKQTY